MYEKNWAGRVYTLVKAGGTPTRWVAPGGKTDPRISPSLLNSQRVGLRSRRDGAFYIFSAGFVRNSFLANVVGSVFSDFFFAAAGKGDKRGGLHQSSRWELDE